MDARHWNGDDDRQFIGQATGKPEKFKCLDCPWCGSGYFQRRVHWEATLHRIVVSYDPRAKDAPRG